MLLDNWCWKLISADQAFSPVEAVAAASVVADVAAVVDGFAAGVAAEPVVAFAVLVPAVVVFVAAVFDVVVIKPESQNSW